MNDSRHLDLLCQANASIIRFLMRSSDSPAAGSGEELQALLQMEETLHSVGLALRDGRLQDVAQDPDIREQISLYCENLMSLRRELSVMQEAAIACRTRLYRRQHHLQAVKDWCTASRETR